jgi:hypothetical protein
MQRAELHSGCGVRIAGCWARVVGVGWTGMELVEVGVVEVVNNAKEDVDREEGVNEGEGAEEVVKAIMSSQERKEGQCYIQD